MEEREVKAVKDLLEKYKNLKAPKQSIIDLFCRVVDRELGFTISSQGVSYNVGSRTVVINKPGPQKQEILLNRKKIISSCKKELGAKNAPTDII